MWIFTNKGFISAVKSDEQPDTMLIRARVKDHLEAILPDDNIIITPENDYRYRCIISKARFVDLVAQLAQDVDYPNFKNTLTDQAYHSAAAKVWGVMYGLQVAK